MKTNELTGTALDWAVALANERNPIIHKIQCGTNNSPFKFKGYVAIPCGNGDCWTYEPSVKWELAGPIIEREHINISNSLTAHWMAFIYDGVDMLYMIDGQTPLIAAMRCYVASKLGDDVDVPEELK